jgi:NTE family protein
MGLPSERSWADFLGSVSVFAALSDEMRTRIASRASSVTIPAGGWLFRRGDPGDSLYVVLSGRLEILLEGEEPQVARSLTRGAVLGELALLTGSKRSGSVCARRDSQLIRIAREDFAELLLEQPQFALELTKVLGSQLQDSRGIEAVTPALPTTIAIVAMEEGLPVEQFSSDLFQALARWKKVAWLDGTELEVDPDNVPAAYGPLLDQHEHDHDQVLLVSRWPRDNHSWSEFCLRQADRIIALTSARNLPPWLEHRRELHGCDLVLCCDDTFPIQMAPWLDALSPRAIHLLSRSSSSALVAELARRLAGRAIGLVLSGGGARGFAHIGVLEELDAAEITIDRVGGCSMGAFIGAMFAMELSPGAIRARCREEFVRGNPLSDYTLPVVSVVRGRKAKTMLSRTFGQMKIEELSREFLCVSCDLLSAELVVHRRGLLSDTVGASMSLPGIFPPVARAGRLLVDGGVLNNLPVGPMASGEGPIVAVDVTARFGTPEGSGPPASHAGVPRWAFRTRRGGGEPPLPNIKETLVRAISIGSVDAVGVARQQADLLIAPETGTVGMTEFEQLDRMVEAGRAAARTALAGAPDFASA